MGKTKLAFLSICLGASLGSPLSALALDIALLGGAGPTFASWTVIPTIPPTDYRYNKTQIGLSWQASLQVGQDFSFVPVPVLSQFGVVSGAFFSSEVLRDSSDWAYDSFWLRYLDIPFLLRFSIVRFLSIFAGGYYGIALAQGPHTLQSSGAPLVMYSHFGFMGGISGKLPLTSHLNLVAMAYYQQGFTPAIDNFTSGSLFAGFRRSVKAQAGIQLEF